MNKIMTTQESCVKYNFVAPLKKTNIKTFSTDNACVSGKTKDKDIPLVAKLIILMQRRDIDFKEIFKYPLGPSLGFWQEARES